MVDLSSHNKNPGAVFDGASFELSDSAAERVDDALAAVRSFVAANGVAPTAGLLVAADRRMVGGEAGNCRSGNRPRRDWKADIG